MEPEVTCTIVSRYGIKGEGYKIYDLIEIIEMWFYYLK